MNTYELNTIWRTGKKAALNGETVDDCPYRQEPRKRAWVLGFKAGLEILRNPNRLPPGYRNDDT